MKYPFLRRALPWGVLALAALALPAASPPPRPASKQPSREEQIALLKRQIEELQKKLDGLTPALPADWTKALHWRCVGPASMGGRIVALAVYEADPTTYWVATASGGLLKTTNNGTTFEHQFDREATVSIGDVAVAQSNKNIVWVGTGEHNPRNSVSWGDGVYKSVDGGKSWKNMGLTKSFQVGRVVIHPKNPDVVYVGALGRLYGPGGDRGLYKTTDGGKTWERILHVDDHTGVIEVQMHPRDPDTLLVATWERRRDEYDSHAGVLAGRRSRDAKVDLPLEEGYDAYDPIKKWGKGGAIYKTTDGGRKWAKVTRGLPSCELGRIGIDYYRKNPDVVYAVVDCQKIGTGTVPGYMGVATGDRPQGGAALTEVSADSPAQKAGLKVGDVITAVDRAGVKTRDDFTRLVQKTKPGQKVSLTYLREKRSQTVEVTLAERPDIAEARRPQIGVSAEQVPGGLKVTGVAAGEAAAKAGIVAGDVVVSVQNKKVATIRQLRDALAAARPGDKLAVELLRGKETKTVALVAPPPRRVNPRPYAFWYGGQRENVQEGQGTDGHEYGGVYRSEDGGESWKRVNSVNPRPMYFSQVRVDPSDDKLVYVLGIRLYRSSDGGKRFAVGGDDGVHADQHALWINPKDGRHLLIGTDGGTYVSYDRGQKWDYLNTRAVGQFYHVCVDTRRPYRVYGGMQDNGSWGGPSHTLDGRGPLNSDWIMVQGGDGFVCRVDPSDPDTVYAESQEGNLGRHDVKTGRSFGIKPRAPAGQQPYRFNWNTPFILSAHNPRIVYAGGCHVFRSVKRGEDWKVISPEIPRTGKGSASAVAESPRNPDVLWAGSDDGNLWVTKDGGKNWANVAAKVGLPKPYWVSTIEPSRYAEGRCYVCFDGHRNDNDEPHLYVTEDYGQTWKTIRGDLPSGASRCLREDLVNPDVLYLGTEFAAWASIDRGTTWTKINNNLPTVAIHEMAQHPTTGEMAVATHGRSIWVLDVAPLRQLKPVMTKEAATLLAPSTAVRWRREPQRGTVYGSGHRDYFGENPAFGAQVYYALTKKAGKLELLVQDYNGKTVATLQAPNEPGLHRVSWNTIAGQGFAPPGQYRVVLKADDRELTQGLKVENDPTLPAQTPGTDSPPQRKKKPVMED